MHGEGLMAMFYSQSSPTAKAGNPDKPTLLPLAGFAHFVGALRIHGG
jgi:hypothetical protein